MSNQVYLLDYGAGNVLSLINAVRNLGYEIIPISSATDFEVADKIIFPGVGNFGLAMQTLKKMGYYEPLKEYIKKDKPFLGICVGMQCLFESSQEAGDLENSDGLGIIKSKVILFDNKDKSVPHMGWNQLSLFKRDEKYDEVYNLNQNNHYYFVHSYHIPIKNIDPNWLLSSTTYQEETFVSSVQKGNVIGVQFHPEKSGKNGLLFLNSFLNNQNWIIKEAKLTPTNTTKLSKRIVACLDVRTDEQGQLVVTKGDQYDVRNANNEIRNLGDPVNIANKYYLAGADEITFLNITSFKSCPTVDFPMLEILKKASENIFVPLTVGGGIKQFILEDNNVVSAEHVAAMYFRCGADKVSIGSDAVYEAIKYYKNNQQLTGQSTIEKIAKLYGSQAIVISIDPKRKYINEMDIKYHSIKTNEKGINNEQYVWFQCTVKGGRETVDLDVISLIKACEAMGAGEIMVNSIDRDGTGKGFDIELINLVKQHSKLPVIASSGAGNSNHFKQLFEMQNAPEAGLAAGIFHRDELPIPKLKQDLIEHNLNIRL